MAAEPSTGRKSCEESWTVRFPHYGTEPFDGQSGRTSVDHLALGDAGQDRGTDELTP